MTGTRRTLAVVGATAVSGALSGFFTIQRGLTDASSLEGGFHLGLLYGPGFFFGLAIAGVLVSIDRVHWGRGLMWLVASILSWRIALELAIGSISFTNDSGMSLGQGLQMFAIPGAIGAALLGVTHQLLIVKANIRWIALVAGAGAAAGFAVYLITLVAPDGTLTLVAMFALWQVAVGVTLDRWTVSSRAIVPPPAPEATPEATPAA